MSAFTPVNWQNQFIIIISTILNQVFEDSLSKMHILKLTLRKFGGEILAFDECHYKGQF